MHQFKTHSYASKTKGMTDVKIAALNGEKETNIIMKTIEIFRIFERKLLE